MKKRLIIIIYIFEIDDKFAVKSADFFKEIGALQDLLIYLLDSPLNLINSVQIQGGFFKAISTLKIIISNPKTDITDQSEEQKTQFLQNKKIF